MISVRPSIASATGATSEKVDWRPVELAPAMVGDDHGIDADLGSGHSIVHALDPLQRDRPVPYGPQPIDVVPAERRLELCVHVRGQVNR